MLERYIDGRELTVGILDDEPLAVGEIIPDDRPDLRLRGEVPGRRRRGDLSRRLDAPSRRRASRISRCACIGR